jgi:GNAT superfamily N-acetyltransferase
MFAKHHYLSHNHNNAAKVFLAFINNQLAGFISVFHFPHPKVKNFKTVHRLVIFPDYQGLGIGVMFLNEIGKIYRKENWRFTIITSAPSLMFALKKSTLWNLKQFGRKPPQNINTGNPISTRKSDSSNRLTTSWELT